MLIEEKDVQLWRNDVQDYNKQRRDRGYENPKVHIITQKIIKEREQVFDPVLQVYHTQALENEDLSKTQAKLQAAKAHKIAHIGKYAKNFDIVNLEKIALSEQLQQLQSKSQRGEFRTEGKSTVRPQNREFNIITNNQYDTSALARDAHSKDEKRNEFKKYRDFNIISNKYTQDHENRLKVDAQKTNEALEAKYRKTHHYDFVAGQCYDKNEEITFQEQLKIKQQEHGKAQILKLPPSLRFRETVIFDRTKPVPEEIKLIDQQNENAKRRFKLRYVIENEYHDRNIEEQERTKIRQANGLCDLKYLDEHQKGFDLITLEKTDIHDVEKMINKKPPLTSWDKVQLTKKDDDTDNQQFTQFNYDTQNQDNSNKVNLPKIGRANSLQAKENNENDSRANNQFDTAPEQLFPRQSQTAAQQDNNSLNPSAAAARPPRQARKPKTPQQYEENSNVRSGFEGSSYGADKGRDSVGSRGSVISSGSSQNKFRIKTGGFNN